jgi:hypothetical protein
MDMYPITDMKKKKVVSKIKHIGLYKYKNMVALRMRKNVIEKSNTNKKEA